MSMISAQCDELRVMAESVGLEVPQAATLMMEAADTITELRGALQVASVDYRHLEAENAKLREERDYYKALWEHATVTDCELRRVRAAWKEDREKNAKLRELCADIYKRFRGVVFECWAYSSEDFRMYERRMRELGVEVDG